MANSVAYTHKERNGQANTLLRILQGSIMPCILLLTWELAVRVGFFPNTVIASPTQVSFKFFIMIGDLRLFKHSYVSLGRLLIGFTIGTALGVLLGSIVGYSRSAAGLLEPLILILIPVPPIVWIPLLIIIFGIGELSKISLIAIAGSCILFIHTAYGIRSADKNLVEVAYVLEKSRRSLFLKILLPSAIPNILSSMRIAMTVSWALLMASEIIASSKGLGWLMWDARNFSRPDDMIVGMITVGILGKLTDSMLVRIEKNLTRWRRVYGDV